VLSDWPADEKVIRRIRRGQSLSGTYYHAPPLLLRRTPDFDDDDVRLSFFVNFPELSNTPPFEAGFFEAWPGGVMEIESGEFDWLKGTDWEEPSFVFTSSTGDEMLVSSTGRVGWLLHEDRTIWQWSGNFDELLTAMVSRGQLMPYLDYKELTEVRAK